MHTIYEEARENLYTVRDWLRFCHSRLNDADVYFGHGTDNPWDEAVFLILRSLNLPLNIRDQELDARLLPSERQYLSEQIAARIEERIPVAYLVNEAWFCGLPFYVDERVLVPRSPIAELIENGISPWLDGYEPESILDLCCGSGCIGIAAAHAFPDAEVDLLDYSEDALEVAEINIERFNLEERVGLMHSDLFDRVGLLGKRYDLILSNPPYVDAEDIASMPAEYHVEPAMGLGSGQDGLDITRRILCEAADYLTDDGLLVVEVGNSWVNLEARFPDVPFVWVEFEHGGHGVFVMTRDELVRHQAKFRV